MPDSSAVFTNGRVKALEEKLLTQQDFQRLSELSPAAAARFLSERGFGAGAGERANLDALCDAEERSLWEFVDEASPDRELTDLFKLDADAVNLKLLIKAEMLGASADGLPFGQGVFDSSALIAANESGDWSFLPRELESAVIEAKKLASLDRPDIQRVCAAVDGGIYRYIFSALKRKKASGLMEYFKHKADCVNLMSLLRARALGMSVAELGALMLDGGRVEKDCFTSVLLLPADEVVASLADCFAPDSIRKAAELYAAAHMDEAKRSLDDSLFELMYSRRNEIFGIEPLVNFLLSKQSELQRLRGLSVRSQKGGVQNG